MNALFEWLVDDLKVQIAASVDSKLSEINRHLTRLERRLDQLDPDGAKQEPAVAGKRVCSLCERQAVARGLCSAHYQQWRYRERRTKKPAAAADGQSRVTVPSTMLVSRTSPETSDDN